MAEGNFVRNPDGSWAMLTQVTGSKVALQTQLPVDLLQKSVIKVSCMGDSITAGDSNLPNTTYFRYPQKLSHMLAQNSLVTVKTGENLWVEPAASLLTAGTAVAAGEYTLTTSGTEGSPRFAGNPQPLTKGDMFLITGEIDSANSAGNQLALRCYGSNGTSNGGFGPEIVIGGHDISTGGYKTVFDVVSADYLLSTSPTATHITAGGRLFGTTASVVSGKIRNLQLYKLTKGVAIHNQGISGENSEQGKVNSRLSQIASWAPDICVIAYGTNDIRQNGIVITKEQFVNNLEQIVIKLQENGIYPILATIPPLASDQTNYEKVQEWNDAIKKRADALHVGIWDRYRAFSGDIVYLADGRHPTRDGYHLLAWSVYQILLGRVHY